MEERIRPVAESHALGYDRCLEVAIETCLDVRKIARMRAIGAG